MKSTDIEDDIIKKYGKGDFDPILYKILVELKTAVIEEFSESLNSNTNEPDREIGKHY